MKLWQKGNTNLNEKIEAFTVGEDRELDLLLAPYDVLGSMAHVKMLADVGLLEAEELDQLLPALSKIYQLALAGDLVIEDGIEDIHSQVELMLTRMLGDLGKKIHSGRSRNDQVLLDLRLYFRVELRDLVKKTEDLIQLLLAASERYKEELLPGYTHLQVAMVSSFGLWFGAYAESLVDDLQQCMASHSIVNRNPLGSAAGYGSSFPLNRQMTTDLLGFEDMAYNVVYAQMGRGKTELSFAFALASIGQTLNKMATDVCLYNSQNFGFLGLPMELTTGSSIMPHKKNPDVFELLRGRTNQLMNLPGQLTQLIGNMPSGYHRDFQLLKEMVFPAIRNLHDCLDIVNYTIPRLEVKSNLLDDAKYDLLFSVEAVNKEVINGLAFRDAYRKIGEAIEAGSWEADRTLQHNHEGSMGNLMNEAIKAKMESVLNAFGFGDWEQAIEQLASVG